MRFLAAVIAVPVLLIGWQLWSDHSFEQRLEPIAAGISGRPDTVNCQSFWGGLIDAQAREGEVSLRCVGSPGAEAVPHAPDLPAPAEVRRSQPPRRARLPGGDRLDRRRAAAVRLRVLRPRRGRRSTPCSSWRTRATTRAASPTRPPPTASRSRRWPGRRCSWERRPARRSCSPARWRRSSRGRAASTGRPSVTPAGSSISTRRPPRSRPSIRSCRRSATAACRRSSAGLVGRSARPTLQRADSISTRRTREESTMDDATIHERIEKLVNEEHELWQREAAGNADEATRQRLAEVKVSLDQTLGSAPPARGAPSRPHGPRRRGRARPERRRELPPVGPQPVILDNGVIRTLDPSLPTCGALAIAGPIVAGGVGTHEWMLPTPERVNLAGRCVLPAFTDSHVHFPTWSLARHDVRLEEADSVAAALALVAGHARRGTWIRGTGWRDAAWRERPADGRRRRSTRSRETRRRRSGRRTTTRSGSTPPASRAQAGTSTSPAGSSSATPTGDRRGSCARSRPGASATATSRSPRTSGSTRRARASASPTRTASPRSTTRTAGSAPPRSSAASTSRKGCRCASGSRFPSTGCPRSLRCRCGRGSATTSSASAT